MLKTLQRFVLGVICSAGAVQAQNPAILWGETAFVACYAVTSRGGMKVFLDELTLQCPTGALADYDKMDSTIRSFIAAELRGTKAACGPRCRLAKCFSDVVSFGVRPTCNANENFELSGTSRITYALATDYYGILFSQRPEYRWRYSMVAGAGRDYKIEDSLSPDDEEILLANARATASRNLRGYSASIGIPERKYYKYIVHKDRAGSNPLDRWTCTEKPPAPPGGAVAADGGPGNGQGGAGDPPQPLATATSSPSPEASPMPTAVSTPFPDPTGVSSIKDNA